MNREPYSILCLGDSYTIGECVLPEARFPSQVVTKLRNDNLLFSDPLIIATTGWTTDELDAAIESENIQQTFDFVTLLIGVNNQYRGRSVADYRFEFRKLLERAIAFAGNRPNHVFVISIPDWGVTPFGHNDKRGVQKIGEEIDIFNEVNKQEALKSKTHYIDITPYSRTAAVDSALIARDGLHPSGKMYAAWSEKLVKAFKKEINR